MSTTAPTTDVVAELRDQVARWPGIEWIGGRLADDALVILVQRDGGVEGVRVPVEGSSSALDDGQRSSLVIDVMLELVQQHTAGVPLAVDWAEGLVALPAEVRWHGGAVAQFARDALGRLHSSAQGCAGYSPL